MRPSRLLAVLACAALTGCVKRIVIQGGNVPPMTEAKLPWSVAVPRDAWPANDEYLGAGSVAVVEIRYREAVQADFRTFLEGLFREVEYVQTPKSPTKADFRVQVSPLSVGFALYVADPETEFLVTSFVDRKPVKVPGGLGGNIAVALSLGLLAPVVASVEAAGAHRRVREALREQYALAAEALRRDPKLAEYAKKKVALRAAEARADDAAGRGRVDEAQAQYRALLAEVDLAEAEGQRVLGKYAVLLPRADAPEVPEEARRLMVQGQTLFKQAGGDAEYASAIAKLSEVVRIAPWWPAAYYNLALAYEGAKKPKLAAAFLGLYLKAQPDAPDAGEVRKRMYALEVAK